LFLKELRLKNYRGFDDLTFKPDADISLLIGRNANGKTSILESLYLCSTGRSHRTNKEKELIQWDKSQSYISSCVEKATSFNIIEVYLNAAERKKIKINGTEITRLGELMGNINCVIFTNDESNLVKEGPSERRKFMDIAISQVKPAYFYNLQQYNKILNQRNALLKEIGKNSSLKKTLRVWNEQIALAGSYITHQRYLFIEQIMKIVSDNYKMISGNHEKLILKYKPNIPVKEENIEKIYENMLNVLINCEEEDLRKGNTNYGCHRDDLMPTLNGVDLRSYGSSGQQTTAVLSIKFAEIFSMKNETGEYPLLLFDDCLSELDFKRQQIIFEMLAGFQTIMTITDMRKLPESFLNKTDIYEVDQGRILRQKTNIDTSRLL